MTVPRTAAAASAAAALAAGPVPGRPGRARRSEALAGYLFIAVPMVLFLVLNIGSILYALYISVWEWNIRSGPVAFVGLDNYAKALQDPTFITAIRNIVYYTVLWVPLTMAAGLFLAVIVNQRLRGQAFFRSAYYFPAIASSAAITTLWIFLLAPFGLFNDVRAAMGLNPLFELLGYGPHHNWFGSQATAMNSIIVLNVWTTSGTFMLFYLASLQSIGREVYEAAAIDGAGVWQTFRKVTFPLLRPGHYFVATVAVIGALQLFDQAYIGGGVNGDPNNALMTIVLYLYNAAFKQFDFSYAAAVGIILFVLIFGATLIQRRLFGQAPQW
ncbi:MAG: sugar ABC transporter permease [Chloroflexota bacterium]